MLEAVGTGFGFLLFPFVFVLFVVVLVLLFESCRNGGHQTVFLYFGRSVFINFLACMWICVLAVV